MLDAGGWAITSESWGVAHCRGRWFKIDDLAAKNAAATWSALVGA